MSLGTPIMFPPGTLLPTVIASDVAVGYLVGLGTYKLAVKRTGKAAGLVAAAVLGYIGAEGFHKVVWSGRI